MDELFKTIIQMATNRLDKEKETGPTDETLRLISLAVQMRPWVHGE